MQIRVVDRKTIKKKDVGSLTGSDQDTATEGISCKVGRTRAYWTVVRHVTLCIHPTSSWTWVHTLVAGASFITSTV